MPEIVFGGYESLFNPQVFRMPYFFVNISMVIAEKRMKMKKMWVLGVTCWMNDPGAVEPLVRRKESHFIYTCFATTMV